MEWTGARYADLPTVEVSTWIEAPAEHVWRLVSDIGLMPGLSQELQSVEWLDGVSQPAVGARFLGHGDKRRDLRHFLSSELGQNRAGSGLGVHGA